jgi:PAS domain S-box-containing protein
MAKPIRLLIVEDDEDDLELLLREIRRGGFDPEYLRVDTPQAMRDALTRDWDLVISDFSMPQFSAPAALKLLRDTGQDLPFIIVSGSIGEDHAVATLKSGAADFITKGMLGRLVGALERELREADSRRARRRAEALLKESNARLRTVVAASPLGKVVLDPAGLVRLWNPAAERIFGWSEAEVLGQPVRFISPDTAAEFALLAEGVHAGKSFTAIEARWLTKSGAPVQVSTSLAPLRNDAGAVDSLLAVIEDITERKNLERQLFQAQKMDAIGKLAGGVAHDFNNLLTVINGRCHRILAKLQPEDPLWREADIINQTGERAAKLVRQLLAFSRKQIFQPQILELNVTISEMGKMLKSLIGEGIDLVTLLDPDLKRIKSSAAQIEQIILNLVVNASEAMPHGGRLTIQTANVRIGEEAARSNPDAVPGMHVALTVSDTGLGMDPATLARIFEPFYTTKAQGSGLGLATVYGIAKHSGGFITVTSELGRGATFRVCFPASDEQSVAQPGSGPHRCLLGANETILVVEDEDDVRSLVVQVLESQGCQVMAARNWVETFGLVKKHTGRIHLLLTDVVMPQMSGREIAASLAPLCPGMKVLYMSGYTDSAIVQHGVLEPGIKFLQKPFSPDTLVKTIREVLDEG